MNNTLHKNEPLYSKRCTTIFEPIRRITILETIFRMLTTPKNSKLDSQINNPVKFFGSKR